MEFFNKKLHIQIWKYKKQSSMIFQIMILIKQISFIWNSIYIEAYYF